MQRHSDRVPVGVAPDIEFDASWKQCGALVPSRSKHAGSSRMSTSSDFRARVRSRDRMFSG